MVYGAGKNIIYIDIYYSWFIIRGQMTILFIEIQIKLIKTFISEERFLNDTTSKFPFCAFLPTSLPNLEIYLFQLKK